MFSNLQPSPISEKRVYVHRVPCLLRVCCERPTSVEYLYSAVLLWVWHTCNPETDSTVTTPDFVG